MTTFAEMWEPSSAPMPEFKPVARYFVAMDCLIYLQEECSYRTVYVNDRATVLLHPYEDRPVGIKVKGMHYMHERLKAILQAAGMPEAKLSGIPLISYWELSLTNSGEAKIKEAEAERQNVLAQKAKVLVKEAGPVVDDEEILEAA